MLRSVKGLKHYMINATDGLIGHVQDFYFDDADWVLRYLVVETGSWLSSRQVLISPISFEQPNWSDHTLSVSISKKQVQESPDINVHETVSRQNEERFMGHYGYPYYWSGTGIWGDNLFPSAIFPGGIACVENGAQTDSDRAKYLRFERARHREDDPHLRSCQSVSGYQLNASDGEIGHVTDYLIDDETWVIRYLVINTSGWWLGHHVLIAPAWITGIDWLTRTVSVDVSQQSVRHAPAYEPRKEWTRELENRLYDFHGRSGYWNPVTMLERTI